MSSLWPRNRPTWTSRTYPGVERYNLPIDLAMGNHVDNLCRFIGKTGGEIFHEMMLRQNVEHICKPRTQDWAV